MMFSVQIIPSEKPSLLSIWFYLMHYGNNVHYSYIAPYCKPTIFVKSLLPAAGNVSVSTWLYITRYTDLLQGLTTSTILLFFSGNKIERYGYFITSA